MAEAVARADAEVARDRGQAPRPFSLLRNFSLLSFFSIAAISIVSAVLLSWFLRTHLLERDAVVTMELVQSIADTQQAASYFRDPPSTRSPVIEEFFRHIVSTPDTVRANIFDAQRHILWSSEPHLIGEAYDNDELDRALAGQLVLEHGYTKVLNKPEHILFPDGMDQYVEMYMPVRDRAGTIVGVVELYKMPRVLIATVNDGTRLIWAHALLGGLFLYFAQFWIVQRAADLIRRQQLTLVETEKLAIVGEMASAVAHGIRNPLASIRSSAELLREDSSPEIKEYAGDIIAEADALERSVRELLVYSRLHDATTERRADIAVVLHRVLSESARRLERAGISVALEMPPVLPQVRGDPDLLAQLINTLIANAHEAMPQGGRIAVAAGLEGNELSIRVSDTGPGIPKAKLGELFRPLSTGKRKGLGLGLFLARRILERWGGGLALENAAAGGATAILRLQVAA